MQSRNASTGGGWTALWGTPCSCLAGGSGLSPLLGAHPARPQPPKGKFSKLMFKQRRMLSAGSQRCWLCIISWITGLRAKRWSSTSAMFCDIEVAWRRHSVGWILWRALRTGWQSPARFLSLARVMAKAYQAFEDLCFELSRCPHTLAVAKMLPPPVASTEHWVRHGTAPVANLAWSLLKHRAFLVKNVLGVSPGWFKSGMAKRQVAPQAPAWMKVDFWWISVLWLIASSSCSSPHWYISKGFAAMGICWWLTGQPPPMLKCTRHPDPATWNLRGVGSSLPHPDSRDCWERGWRCTSMPGGGWEIASWPHKHHLLWNPAKIGWNNLNK